MQPLTLHPRRWYAMDYLAPQVAFRHASPIWTVEITPAKAGTGELQLGFHHAAYSEGVQDKRYTLKVLRRTVAFLLAEQIDGTSPHHPLLIITEITPAWIQLHWPHLRPEGDLQSWCDDEFGRPGHPARSH